MESASTTLIDVMSTEKEQQPNTAQASSSRPLDGVRVLEVGQLIAGPTAGTVLAYFGAEVIKVEPPAGDPIGTWRVVVDGTSLWWSAIARNKKCLALDLRHEKGRDIARALASKCDVIIESFRPGTMEKWGLGPEDLKTANPGLVYARVTGYGQDGPYARGPATRPSAKGLAGSDTSTASPIVRRCVQTSAWAIPSRDFTRRWNPAGSVRTRSAARPAREGRRRRDLRGRVQSDGSDAPGVRSDRRRAGAVGDDGHGYCTDKHLSVPR